MHKQQLPIESRRGEILDALKNSQVLIVLGETGSGKTTMLPQFLYHAGYASTGAIGMTEPRRIAAASVAGFVADSLGVEIGQLVGYKTRYETHTSKATKIKFMTDGILLQEIQRDPELSRYSVIVVDEAHERSTNIDFLLGLLKDLLVRRPEFKLVVTSATIDSQRFSEYFGGAPVIEVQGRTYDVDIRWGKDTFRAEELLTQTADTVVGIHQTKPRGDILVFMSGADDITMMHDELIERIPDAVILPAHGNLSSQEQARIFQAFPGKRKIVLATNMAETSITIDGIVYVVDTGLIKQANYHAWSGIRSLDLVEHSQAGCNQRAGRAGRTRNGVCYRMYSKDNFQARPRYTQPEITRTGLASVVLQMEAIGIKDVENFDLIERPDRAAFRDAYKTLVALGAIDPVTGILTKIGKEMSGLPLEPRVARMVLEARRYGCVMEVATIAAFLSARNVYVRPQDKRSEADTAHLRLKRSGSDIVAYLNVWSQFEGSGFDRLVCKLQYLSYNVLEEVHFIREQILHEVARSWGVDSFRPAKDVTMVKKAVAAGLIQNLMHKVGRFTFAGLMSSVHDVFIHPGSAAFNSGDNSMWVCIEVVTTSKKFARGISDVDPSWLPEIAPSNFAFGEEAIHAVGETVVMLRTPVLFIGNPDIAPQEVAHVERTVSFAEALRIQEASVTQAKAKGWRRLMFRDWVCDLPEGALRCSYGGLTPENGTVYYGTVENAPSYVGYKFHAVPRLKVFLLQGEPEYEAPAEKPKPAERLQPVVQTPEPVAVPADRSASATDLAELLEVFGGGRH